MATGPSKLALTLASMAIPAIETINQSIAADRAARFEATRDRQRAEQERQLAAQRAESVRNREARRRAALRARVAGRGVTFEGSPLAVLSDVAADGAHGANLELASGERSAVQAEGDARLRRFRGRVARQSGFLRSGGTLLTRANQHFG